MRAPWVVRVARGLQDRYRDTDRRFVNGQFDGVDHHLPAELLAGGVVVLRRTARPFSSATELLFEKQRVILELDGLGRAGKHLLVDVRSAPPLTNDQLSPAFASLRGGIRKGFGRVAVLTRTKVGILQAGRMRQQDGTREQLFDRETDALAYLRGARQR